MGAAFDVQYYGAVPFIASTGIVPLTGSILAVAGKAVFDFFIFFGSVSLSSWFLVMMGIEMGSLVVFKIRKTRDMETRIRLSLMLVAYGIYSILLPSFIIQNPASVPFIGWSMGIGTAGPVSPLLILPMLLTYVISGILSLLFGSRQLCSVFCTAPVMYQGTFYDSMKKFNTSSGMSKSLTRADRTGNMVYRIVSNMVYVSVIAAAVISWLDSTGRLNLTFYGTDPEYMLYIFYFGFLWYAVFILMPYVGSYGCINTGYCQWGNFNRFISRFGFFRLKVRDPNQCVTCPTKDCASACPVGNYGQPGSFITTGEYKDSRCVGIGDCVNACPYENIFYYDVRHWVKEKISKK
jgi:polyferredoxin